MNNEKLLLDISWSTILKISLAVVSFYFLYLIRDILIWFIFALIIATLFEPAIRFFQKLKIPRFLSIIFVYVAIFGLFSLMIYLTIPIFIPEIQQFLQLLPQYFEKASFPLKSLGLETSGNLEGLVGALTKTLGEMTKNIFSILSVIFGGIFSAIFIITLAIFLSFEERFIEKPLVLLFPKEQEAFALNLWQRCRKRVVSWFGTRILACFFVGLLSFLAFWLFNLKYAFTLAFLAGVLNFIPFLGPLFAGFLIFVVVALDSISRATFALTAFILIQLIENNILTPLLSKKFVDLSPALVLVALTIGGKLWGFMGAILAVPLTGILFEFLKEFLKKRKEKEAIIL